MMECLLVSICSGNARKQYVDDFKKRWDKREFYGYVLDNYDHFILLLLHASFSLKNFFEIVK